MPRSIAYRNEAQRDQYSVSQGRLAVCCATERLLQGKHQLKVGASADLGITSNIGELHGYPTGKEGISSGDQLTLSGGASFSSRGRS